MYQRAMAGEIKNFTRISSPYEKTEGPEPVLDSAPPIAECVYIIVNHLVG